MMSFWHLVVVKNYIKAAVLQPGSKAFPVISGILDPEESYYAGFHCNQELNKISIRCKRRNASTLDGLQLQHSC